MSINYDVTKDLRYLEGKEIGIASNTKELIQNMLINGKLSLIEIAEIAKFSIDDVIAIHNEMNGK